MTDLLETTEDGIAWLTLNRPDRLNALSPAMLSGLGDALVRDSQPGHGTRCVSAGYLQQQHTQLVDGQHRDGQKW